MDERSACIDGHRKIALPTDHFKINKFENNDCFSFQAVAGVVIEMAKDAGQKVHARRHRKLRIP